MLAGETGVPFVVGDDDQSIYAWRGAKIENILRFEKDFPDTRVITLEQNYRSTGNILKAANALIANNTARLGKNLWTAVPMARPSQVYAAYNEQDEAQFVIERIKHWQEHGGVRHDVAMLYRSNAQSRVFEERLMPEAIPYRVYGGRASSSARRSRMRLPTCGSREPQRRQLLRAGHQLPARGIGSRAG